jgi:hypothetical protein
MNIFHGIQTTNEVTKEHLEEKKRGKKDARTYVFNYNSIADMRELLYYFLQNRCLGSVRIGQSHPQPRMTDSPVQQ